MQEKNFQEPLSSDRAQLLDTARMSSTNRDQVQDNAVDIKKIALTEVQDEEEFVLDTESEQEREQTLLSQRQDDKDEKTAMDNKIKDSKAKHREFHDEWQNFLQLKGQIKSDYERFKADHFSAKAPPKAADDAQDQPDEGDEEINEEEQPDQGAVDEENPVDPDEEEEKEKKPRADTVNSDIASKEVKYKAFDFKNQLRNEKLASSVEFPFTNTHIEDSVFVIKPGAPTEFIIALECVFYMTDCHYMQMEPQKYAPGVPSHVNRMGTENYVVADFDKNIDQSPFSTRPLNLKVNREESYTNQIKKVLMKTQNSEARVEYFITKWQYNHKGSLRKVEQSESFRFDKSRFMPHKLGQMELQITADGLYVYIVNKQVGNMGIKVWDTETLSMVPDYEKPNIKEDEGTPEEIQNRKKENQNISRIKNAREYLKEQESQEDLSEIELVCNNQFLAVTYSKNSLDRFDLILLENQKIVFSLDCRFDANNLPKHKVSLPLQLEQSEEDKKSELEQNEETKNLLFPIKVQMDESELNEFPSLKVLFMYKRICTFKECKYSKGYPCLWVDLEWNFEKQYKEETDPQKILEQGKKQAEKIMKEYIKKKDEEKAKKEKQKQPTKEEEKKSRYSMGGKPKQTPVEEQEEVDTYTPGGKFYVLDKKIFTDEGEKDQVLNISIKANRDFKYFCVIKQGHKGLFWVFSEDYSIKESKLDAEHYIKQSHMKKRGKFSFIRNQNQKPNVYCVFKTFDNETIVNCFLSKDPTQKKKSLKLQHSHDNANIDAIFLKMTQDPEIEDAQIGVLSLAQYSQQITFKTFQPDEGKYDMNLVTNRCPVTQKLNAQYPCLATNLGYDCLNFHINLNPSNAKSLVYAINSNKGENSETEIFLDFVQLNDFKELGLDETFINIDTCSRFVYLTKSKLKYEDKKKRHKKKHQDPTESIIQDDENEEVEQAPKPFFKVWINVLIIDPFNRIPQVAHFKSSKIFKLHDEENCMDVMEACVLFKIDDELHLMAQFPRGLYHSQLSSEKDDMRVFVDQSNKSHSSLPILNNRHDPKELFKFAVDGAKLHAASQITDTQGSHGESFVGGSVLSYSQGSYSRAHKKKKGPSLSEQLKGNILPVQIFQDKHKQIQNIYFVTTQNEGTIKKGDETNQVEIKQYCPIMNSVTTLITLQTDKILAFTQLLDGRFIIINEDGEISLYSKNKTGAKLQKSGKFYVHEEDTQFITESIEDFEDIIIDKEIMILKSRIIFLHPRQSDVIPNILKSQDLQEEIRSDFQYYLIKGPLVQKGQKQFIEMFMYNDSGNIDYFLYRQRVYKMPNSKKQKLLYDFNSSCKLSTFLYKGDILAQFGYRFLTFSSYGNPLDEIEFQYNPLKNKGGKFNKDDDQNYFVVYWQNFIMQNDSGINKKIYKTKPRSLQEFQENYREDKQEVAKGKKFKKTFTQIINNSSSEVYDKAKAFVKKIKQQNKFTAYILVEIDQNYGLQFRKHGQQGSYWHEQLVKQATNDYFQKYEMVTMCEDNKYFLFFNNFEGRFELWDLQDKTQETIKNFLEQSYEKDKKKPVIQSAQEQQKVKQIIIEQDTSGKMNGDNVKVKKLYDKCIDTFPEIKCPPENLNLKTSLKYIKKYLEPVNLELKHAKIRPEEDPQNWNIHKIENLLNNDKTKFNSRKGCLTMTLDFSKAQQISAFGFQSANNFPHLDPKNVRIKIKTVGKYPEWKDVKFKLPGKDTEQTTIELDFKNRFQILNFIKPLPYQQIKEVQFTFQAQDLVDKTAEEAIRFQLSQILIYQKRTRFDFRFQKLKVINFWTDEGENIKLLKDKEKNMLEQLGSKLFPDAQKNPQVVKFQYIAFLKQSNVIKHVYYDFDSKAVRVIFSYCDQDIKRKGQMTLLGHIFQDKQQPNKFTYFEKFFKIDGEKQEKDAKRINKKIQKLIMKNESFFIEQQSLPSHQKDFEKLSLIQMKQREEIYKYSLMVSVKFGKKWVIIKESQDICAIKFSELMHGHQANIIHLSKECYKKLTFKLPSVESEVLDIHFVKYFYPKNYDELKLDPSFDEEEYGENIVQILAMDYKNQVLVIATWDVSTDQEISMHQIFCDEKYPKSLFLQGVCLPKTIKKGGESITVTQGANNYLLQGDLIVDLKNSVPYIYSTIKQVQSPKYIENYKNTMPFVKKMLNNTSRFLGIARPHHLIFDHCLKDIQYIYDVIKNPEPTEILEKLDSVLPLFRLKYRGQSLFHYFAANMNIQGVIKLVFEQYMKAKEQNQLIDQSITQMPLFILSPDDDTRLGALEIAMIQKKPQTFEMMVAMLRDFQDICSSKMMLANFQNMISIQALDYFDKSQFNPPLLQVPYVVEWPDDTEEIVFTTKTSLVNKEMIDYEVLKYKQSQEIWLQEKMIQIIDTIFILVEGATKTGLNVLQGRSIQTENFQLKIHETKSDNHRRITVQALDFDWIFDGDNTKNFIKLLQSQGNNQVFEQYTIKVFVGLMWQKYRPEIIKYEFFPYLGKLFSFFMLSSTLHWNYINEMALYEMEDGLRVELKGHFTSTNKTMLIIYQVFLQCMCLGFISHYFFREFKQYRESGHLAYISSFWNIWGFFTELLCLIYIVNLFMILGIGEEGIELNRQREIRQYSAYGVFMLWIKMFYWMGLWPEPAYFLVQLSKTLTAVSGFLILFFFVLIAFANYFFILQLNNPEGGWADEDGQTYNYVEGSIDNVYLDAFISMYLLSLGEFNSMDGYSGGYNVKSAWFMFLLATVILLLMFMNMVIAVMSEPFEDVKESKEAYQLQQQLDFIVDFQDLVDLKEDYIKEKYIMVIKPEQVEAVVTQDSDEVLQANTQKIKEMSKDMKRMHQEIIDKFSAVERDVGFITKKTQEEVKEKVQKKKEEQKEEEQEQAQEQIEVAQTGRRFGLF